MVLDLAKCGSHIQNLLPDTETLFVLLDNESGLTGEISKKELRMLGRPKPKYSVWEMICMVNNLILSHHMEFIPKDDAKL